jgi:hypothetical protein
LNMSVPFPVSAYAKLTKIFFDATIGKPSIDCRGLYR